MVCIHKILRSKEIALVEVHEVNIFRHIVQQSRYRRFHFRQNIPVVFLTGVSDRDRIGEVLAMKPRGYLLKPIDTDRLKKTIAEIIR